MNGIVDKAGFFGKLPSHGDFVTRRLPRDFLDPWDEWLQLCLATIKSTLGEEQWLDAYLTAPVWFFAMEPGICGVRGWRGLLMPSVDRVGRYFPLTVAAPLVTGMTPLRAATADAQWFEQACDLALTVVEQEDFVLEPFDEAVAELACTGPVDVTTGGGLVPGPASTTGICLMLDSSGTIGGLQRLVDGSLGNALSPYALWWSGGSDRVQSALLWSHKLPPPRAFSALISGSFDDGYWHQPVEVSPS